MAKRKQKAKAKFSAKNTATQQTSVATTPTIAQWKLAVILFLFAIGLYAQTVTYDYTYDDKTLITLNTITQKGFDGIKELISTPRLFGFEKRNDGRYSPLSTTSHAVMYQFFGREAAAEHTLNVLLYGISIVVLYCALNLLLKNYSIWFPFLATLLFAAHPIHTEVVASIKSRDELLAFLFCIISTFFATKYHDTKKLKFSYFSAIALLLALLSKESAITFLGIIPLFLYFFRTAKVKDCVVSILPHLALAITFLVVRHLVLTSYGSVGLAGKLENPLFVSTVSERVGTAFYILVRYYIGMLFLPHPLVCDYSFNQIPVISLGSFKAIFSIATCAALLYWASSQLKQRTLFSFAVFYFFATISVVSNIPFPIGTIMGERLLYAPSLGFCILVAYLLAKHFKFIKTQSNRPSGFALWVIVAILVIYSAKILDRNPEWKNEESLYEAEVLKSPYSAKMNQSMGNLRLDQARYEESISYFEKALRIFPEDANTLAWLAIVETRRGNKDKAIEIYKKALKINTNYKLGYYKIGLLFLERGEYGNAIKAFDACVTLDRTDEACKSLLERAKSESAQKSASVPIENSTEPK